MSRTTLREEISKPKMIKGNKDHQFITGPYGMLQRKSFEKLIQACKTIGECIWDLPGTGITMDDGDYLPADLMRDPEQVDEALKILEAYFHPEMRMTLDEWNKRENSTGSSAR